MDLFERTRLEAEWLRLTREVLPALAASRGWPVRHDHCFQRILLDAAFEGAWYEHVKGRPAYRAVGDATLVRLIGMAEACAAGRWDLRAANVRSLNWRRVVNAADAAAPRRTAR